MPAARLAVPPPANAPDTPQGAPRPGRPGTPSGYSAAARKPAPVGAFFGRASGGDWAGAARAALWPVGLVVVAAVALAIPAYGQREGAEFAGFPARVRIALALLLQGVGGGFDLHGAEGGDPGTGGTAWLDGGSSLSVVPLTVTALWIAALHLGLRKLRARTPLSTPGMLPARGGGPAVPGARTAGLEAAVRVTVLVAGATLMLELCAQPTVLGVRITSSPVSGTLGALLLTLAGSTAALHRVEAVWWLGTRPKARALLRATATALRALGVVLLLGSATAYCILVQVDAPGRSLDMPDSGATPQLVALSVLPNLGVAALGLGWGAPLRATAGGSSAYGEGYESESFRLPELADAAGTGAPVAAVALGLVSALTVGVLAARRSAGRGERLLAVGVFFGLVLLLAGIGGAGISAHGTASAYEPGGSGSANVSLDLSDTLLLGLLWLTGGAVVGPSLARRAGSGTAGAAPPVRVPEPFRGAGHGHPGAAAIPAPAAPPDHMTRPATAPPDAAPPTATDAGPTPPRSRLVIWIAALAATFLVAAATTAATDLWQTHHTPHPTEPRP